MWQPTIDLYVEMNQAKRAKIYVVNPHAVGKVFLYFYEDRPAMIEARYGSPTGLHDLWTRGKVAAYLQAARAEGGQVVRLGSDDCLTCGLHFSACICD